MTAITASCALTAAGGVKCWGADLTPLDVPGLSSGVLSIATGSGHSCALMRTGGVKCWGLNDFGELGNGTTTSSSTPVGVSHMSSGVTAIAAGAFHTCALMGTGALECWGSNGNGELGDGTTVNRLTPVGVVGFRPVKATLAIVSRSVTVTPARIAALNSAAALRHAVGVRSLWSRHERTWVATPSHLRPEERRRSASSSQATHSSCSSA